MHNIRHLDEPDTRKVMHWMFHGLLAVECHGLPLGYTLNDRFGSKAVIGMAAEPGATMSRLGECLYGLGPRIRGDDGALS